MTAGGPSISTIIAAVAEAYRVRPADIRSEWRAQPVAVARQVAMWLARHLTPMSYPRIGLELGGRHHTTVMHAVSVTAGRMALDAVFEADVLALARLIDDEIQRPGEPPALVAARRALAAEIAAHRRERRSAKPYKEGPLQW